MELEKRSKVWKFFTKVGPERTQCSLCSAYFSYKDKSTSNMKKHLVGKHRKNLDDDKPSSRQTSLSEYNLSKKKLGPDSYLKLNKSLALACALDLRPISLVMGKGFRAFCKRLNPDYKVPCRKTITSNLLKVYEENKTDVIELIADAEVCITTDCWTSVGQVGYITFTGHFITAQWEYKSIILATRPLSSHSAVNIESSARKVQEEFDFKLFALCTDNASPMKLAGKLLNVIHWLCFSHTLQLVVQESLKQKKVKHALDSAKNLVSFFSRSSLATDALKKNQTKDDENKRPLCLVQSVCTRWNSEYQMARRLLELRIPVFQVIMDPKIVKNKDRSSRDLSDEDWKTLENILPILKPFAICTESLTKEDSPTLSQVYVVIHSLVDRMAANADDSTSIANLKRSLKKDLIKRFALKEDGTPANICQPALVATFLDPRYKRMSILTSEEQKQLVEYVEGLVSNPSSGAQVKQEPGTVTSKIYHIFFTYHSTAKI